jgi:chemotaxis protein histidine kinase CheA
MRVDQTFTDDDAGNAEALIKRAEAAVAALRGQFIEWVQKDIAQIDALFREVHGESDAARRAQVLERIRQIAHNIKGQGGTFGYAALSDAAAVLDALIKSGNADYNLLRTGGAVAALHSAFQAGSA